ncbi:MAG: hypothetical protein R3Y54_06500 [Eubacteriales bacterium]
MGRGTMILIIVLVGIGELPQQANARFCTTLPCLPLLVVKIKLPVCLLYIKAFAKIDIAN